MKALRREQITALASLLVMLALMGHSLYHALDYEHYHPHEPHHSHHHHDDHDHHESLPDDDDVPREVAKSELFSLIALPPQTDLVLERTTSEAACGPRFPWSGRQAFLLPNSRAPPQPG